MPVSLVPRVTLIILAAAVLPALLFVPPSLTVTISVPVSVPVVFVLLFLLLPAGRRWNNVRTAINNLSTEQLGMALFSQAFHP